MNRGILYDLIKNEIHDEFIEAFEQYIKEGNPIEDTLIACYVYALVSIGKVDKAYNLLKNLEKFAEKTDSYEFLSELYVKCYKTEDAERMIELKKTPIKDYLNLIKIKLLEGNIKEAQAIINSRLKVETEESTLRMLRSYEQLIKNHLEKGAYIEIDYNYFKKNNTLEPGHIVFLKNMPESDYRNEDEKALKRPYMIWKIEKDILYIFPVSTQDREKSYKLYIQKYPNSKCDRTVKYTLFQTTEDNVVTVQDKVLEEDFKIILTNLYQASCFADKISKRQNQYFMQEYIGEIDKYDVIKEVVHGSVSGNSFHLVLDIEDDHYRTIQVDYKNKKVIGVKSVKYNKDRVIYDVIKPDEETKQKLIEGLSELVTLKSLVGKKVVANNIRYIIVDEDKENYFCIDEIYSPSYINIDTVKKSDVKTITGSVDEEELDRIKNLISLSGYNIKKSLKRARKK